jgi:regulator of protease activity HflC (stomatin/prohibitin superfamily)
MAEKTTNIQDQTCITNDRAPVIIHMLVYNRVTDPLKYVSQAGQSRQDVAHLASSVLKEMVSARLLDQVLSARDELGEAICNKLNQEIDHTRGLQIDKVKVMEIVVSKEILASMPVARIPGGMPGLRRSAQHPGRQRSATDQMRVLWFLNQTVMVVWYDED